MASTTRFGNLCQRVDDDEFLEDGELDGYNIGGESSSTDTPFEEEHNEYDVSNANITHFWHPTPKGGGGGVLIVVVFPHIFTRASDVSSLLVSVPNTRDVGHFAIPVLLQFLLDFHVSWECPHQTFLRWRLPHYSSSISTKSLSTMTRMAFPFLICVL